MGVILIVINVTISTCLCCKYNKSKENIEKKDAIYVGKITFI